MKKKIGYFMAALALCVLGSCGDDKLADNNDGGNSTLVPDENGMVTLNVKFDENGWGNGNPATRTEELPVRSTYDLGNGYIVKTVVREGGGQVAATRAGDVLGKDVSLLMIAFANTDEDGTKPLGYERLKANGTESITVELPAEQTFKLVFYSLNKADEEINPSQYLRGAEANPVNGKYNELASGQFASANPLIPMEDSKLQMDKNDEYKDLSKIPADAMYAKQSGVSTASGSTSTLQLSFKHLLAQAQLVITEAGPNGTISHVDASFYPRYGDPKLNLSAIGAGKDIPANLGGLWTASTSIRGGRLFYEDLSTAISSWTSPGYVRFAPVSTDQAFLYINELDFNDETVSDGSGILKDRSIPLYETTSTRDVPNPKLFKPGHQYTISLSIAKKSAGYVVDPRVKSGDWAASNIYWDGTRLTFDQYAGDGTPDNPDSPYYGGVYFKWGSLVGISPITHVDGDGSKWTTIFRPETAEGSAKLTEGTLIGTYTDEDRVGTNTQEWWGNKNVQSSDYGTRNNQPASPYVCANELRGDDEGKDGGANLYEHYDKYWHEGNLGDICAYITGGDWRMPNNSDILDAVPTTKTYYEAEHTIVPWKESYIVPDITGAGQSNTQPYVMSLISDQMVGDETGWREEGEWSASKGLPIFIDEGGRDLVLKDFPLYWFRYKRADGADTKFGTVLLPSASGRNYMDGEMMNWGLGNYWLSSACSFIGEGVAWMQVKPESTAYHMLLGTYQGGDAVHMIAPVWNDVHRDWASSVRCIKN
ncbi:MAG: hypothetical protein LBN24_02210 [Mediterranea sp.]|jgi:hypothetical protein|nr:hypothetical protein [Mediterranea sp.]